MDSIFVAHVIKCTHIVNLLVPRQFGLLAMHCDFRTSHISKSNFWLIYSIIFACIFSVSYPFAIMMIWEKTNTLSDGSLIAFIEISNHIAMYLVTVAIYIRITCTATHHMNYTNFVYATFNECRTLCNDRRELEYVFSLIIRTTYLYFGYGFLNARKLYQHSDVLNTIPILYKFVYFLPDLVMGNTLLRIHTTFAIQTMSCERINEALSECIDNMIKANRITSTSERLRIYSESSRTFDKLTELHAKIYKITRGTEELTSNLMIFSISKTFAHLSSTVIIFSTQLKRMEIIQFQSLSVFFPFLFIFSSFYWLII